MSDTRNQAEQELVDAGMATGIEDALGSALGSSFKIPPGAPRKPESQSMMAAVAEAEKEAAPLADEQTGDVPGMAEWKDTYEGYLSEWHAESAIAREKAVATRERIEREQEEERKATESKVKAEKAERARAEKARRDEERLQAELEGKITGKGKGHKGRDEERERKVREAWEMVKSAPDATEGAEVTTDSRGVTPEDLVGGQAVGPGQTRPSIKQTAYDPTTSTEPLPPSMRDSPSPPTSYPHPTDSATLSRHSATSQAWEVVSGSPSSGEDVSPPSDSNDDIVKIPRRSTGTGGQRPGQGGSGSGQGPPAAPPSLTLSLFTNPSHLTLARVSAVLGINLVLPFINGVMLGFGEIFAREVFRVGKIWWREGGNFVNLFTGRRDDRSGASRGVAGVGLSGSGGFP